MGSYVSWKGFEEERYIGNICSYAKKDLRRRVGKNRKESHRVYVKVCESSQKGWR